MSIARTRQLPTERGAAIAPAVVRQGAAGGLAALLAFGVLEPARRQAERVGDFNVFQDVVVVGLVFGAFVTAFLAGADEWGSGSPLRVLFRAVLGTIGGAVLGMTGFFIAGFLFSQVDAPTGPVPLHVAARAAGWALFGGAVGLGPGLLSRSDRRIVQGMAGGALGGAVGGAVFDFLALTSAEGTVSRFVGYTVLGLAIGASTAYAEYTNRVAWLTFLTGPQEGRSVVLHRDCSVLGRDELADVSLFGDQAVQRRHALITLEPQPIIEIASPIAGLTIDALPVHEAVLSDGSVIQIGRHRLRFHHRDPDSLPPRLVNYTAPAAPVPEATPMVKKPRGPADNAERFKPGSPLALRVASGDAAGKALRLTRGLTVGRETDNDLTILDPKVSRYHARIEYLEGAWVLSDLGSTNGTRLNGLRIVRAGLVPGDFFYIGDTVISVEEAGARAAEPVESRSEVTS